MSTALFVHHSIGRQLIDAGLRDRLRQDSAIELWDHDYNEIGLSDPSGARLGRSFPVPNDDTDPAGLLPLLRGLANGSSWDVPAHDVLVIKSCFPNSAVSDERRAALQETYLALREVAASLPQTVLLASSPPLVVESTSRTEARNAESLATWLATTWPGPGLAYADLFATLSYRHGPLRGTLRTSYRARRPRDSHLSPAGARAGAELIADAIHRISLPE